MLEGVLKKLRDLECTTWVGTDEDLDSVLEKLTQDSISYEKQYLKVQRENDDILEICNTIIAASKPTVTRPRNTGAGIPANQPNINFKPSSELKPNSRSGCNEIAGAPDTPVQKRSKGL